MPTQFVRDFLHGANSRVSWRKQTSTLELFLAFKTLESVTINILGLVLESRSSFQYIIVIEDRFTTQVEVMPLRRIRKVDVAQAILAQCANKYGPSKALLLDNKRQHTTKSFQCVCQLLESTNVFITTYYTQSNEQKGRNSQTLTAMLLSYVNDNPQYCDAYASRLIWPTTVRYFDLGTLIHSIWRTTGESQTFTAMYSVLWKDAHCYLATTRISSYSAALIQSWLCYFTAYLKTLQKRFDCRLRKDRKGKKTCTYVFIGVWNIETRKLMLQNAVKNPYQPLEQNHRTVVIQRQKLAERIIADKVALVPRPAGWPPIPLKSASSMDSQRRFAKRSRLLFHAISDYYVNDDGQLEFLLEWGSQLWDSMRALKHSSGRNEVQVFYL